MPNDPGVAATLLTHIDSAKTLCRFHGAHGADYQDIMECQYCLVCLSANWIGGLKKTTVLRLTRSSFVGGRLMMPDVSYGFSLLRYMRQLRKGIDKYTANL